MIHCTEKITNSFFSIMVMFYVFLVIVSFNPSTTFRPLLDRSDDIIILYHSNTSSCFGQILCQKQMKFSMTGYTERTISLNALWQCLPRVKTFFVNNMRKKSTEKIIWMDEITKKWEKILFTYDRVHCINAITKQDYEICMFQMLQIFITILTVGWV